MIRRTIISKGLRDSFTKVIGTSGVWEMGPKMEELG